MDKIMEALTGAVLTNLVDTLTTQVSGSDAIVPVKIEVSFKLAEQWRLTAIYILENESFF